MPVATDTMEDENGAIFREMTDWVLLGAVSTAVTTTYRLIQVLGVGG